MSATDELAWLAARRPTPDRPSETSTGYARASLLAHAETRRRRRRTARTLAVGGVLAAAAAVVTVAVAPGNASAPGPRPLRLTVSPPGARTTGASPTPLTRLASDVRLMPSPRQPGDATLVVRDTRLDGAHVIDGAVYGGYDLYTDSGDYYFAPDSLAQLQQTVDAHETVPQDGNQARVLAVLARAAGATPWTVRRALWNAEPHASAAELRRLQRTLPPRVRREERRFVRTPGSARLSRDSQIYIYATQALEIGAGRALVRAGAMKALSTLRGVLEHVTRIDGIRALRVTYPNALPGQGSVASDETIWLDARTGVPIQERDGTNSATRYIVERVVTAHLPTQLSRRAVLR